jgi:thiamine pyrophosphate-dependent acetolactate synthase large subunit-like protein
MAESFLRAYQQTLTGPCGPVYVCLDAALQEQAVAGDFSFPDIARYSPPPPSRPDAGAVAEAACLLAAAERPLILYGRCRRTRQDWERRVALAERLGAAMLSDLKAGSMVPTDHPLHRGPPFNKLTPEAREALRDSDAILSIGWIDLGGLLDQAFGKTRAPVPVIHAGFDLHLHAGWGKEHAGLPPIDVHLLGDPDAGAADLLAALPEAGPDLPAAAEGRPQTDGEAAAGITQRQIALALRDAVGDKPVTFSGLPRGWPGAIWPHRHPLDYLGKDGGGGVGSGPGITIGAALALKDTDRLVVGILGDGDCMMSINALWTAAHYRIPALIVVSNNRSYYNDELHQESVALHRGRNPANRWIGQRLDDPAPDFAAMAEAQGVTGIGPVTDAGELPDAMARAVDRVRRGRPCLVDVHIDPGHGRKISYSMARRTAAKP